MAIGTRIRQSGFQLLQPVTVVGSQQVRETGVVAAGDLFDYVALSGINTFNGIDNYFYGVNDARGDVSTANLRGLGSGNTLILLNGRRIVNHPATQGDNLVIATTANLNTLPLFALERLEILHDGASSIYGSDAVAGVVNAIIDPRLEHTRIGLSHGAADDGTGAKSAANFAVSRRLGKAAHIAVFGEFSDEEGLMASERMISRSSDLRAVFANTAFADDSDVDNRSRSTAWGQFKLPLDVSQNGVPLTSDNGVLHIQPSTFAGCLAPLPGELCVDAGILDPALRFDSNRYRYLSPEVRRINLFSMWTADLSDRLELYGELGWVRSDTRHTREPANPLASHPITIPRDNYWNPFGPVTFADGRPNPNRLPGIDAPAEGLPVLINTRGLGGLYKVVDAGPRIIEVENNVDRWLIGARAWLSDWSFDTAYLYSRARSDDLTRNRVSSTRFQQALAVDTQDAYNPFNGGSIAHPSYGDGTPNPKSVIDGFLIDVRRVNETTLGIWDFAISNPRALNLDGRPLGMSFGGEVRRESFSERRDPRLNGEIGYTDLVSGISYSSDVMQSSITPDSRGSRTVTSVYAEAALSIVDRSLNIPLVRRLDANFAVRLENYSDVGKEWRPRIGLAWWFADDWAVHASWSEGLRAPNLPQVNAAPVPRIQVTRDWYRCQALVNKGLVASLGECDIEALRSVEVTTTGSGDLVAETNSSLSAGIRYRPTDLAGLTLSADYWEIEQQDLVGLFGDDNHVSLDYFLQLEGAQNPAVTRAPLSPEDVELFSGSGLQPVGLLQRIFDPYVNIDRRLTRGVDFAVAYSKSLNSLGRFRFDLEATRLLAARQTVPPAGRVIVDANVPAIQFAGAGELVKRNGRPKWRSSLRLVFERDYLRFGVLASYVGDVTDTTAIRDDSSTFLPVSDWTNVTAFAGIDFRLFGDRDASLLLSVGNLLDESPPAADEDLGYFIGLHDAMGRTYNLSLSAIL